MPPEHLSRQPFDLTDWLSSHPAGAVYLGAFCLWVSVALIIRLWFRYRRAGLLRKLFWSAVLLVPVFGWVLYGALFHMPDYTGDQCPDEHPNDVPWGGHDSF